MSTMDTVITLGSLSAMGTSLTGAAWAVWQSRRKHGKDDDEIRRRFKDHVLIAVTVSGEGSIVIPIRRGSTTEQIAQALTDALAEAEMPEKLATRVNLQTGDDPPRRTREGFS
jgi:hypothetical protein